MAIKKAPRIHTLPRTETKLHHAEMGTRGDSFLSIRLLPTTHALITTTTTTATTATTYRHAPFLCLIIPSGSIVSTSRTRRLAGATLELLSEEDELHLIVDGQDTGTCDTTEDVGASSLEERPGTLNSDDLTESIEGRLVLDGLEKVSLGVA